MIWAMRDLARQTFVVLSSVILTVLVALFLFGNIIASLLGFGAPVD